MPAAEAKLLVKMLGKEAAFQRAVEIYKHASTTAPIILDDINWWARVVTLIRES